MKLPQYVIDPVLEILVSVFDVVYVFEQSIYLIDIKTFTL